MIKIQRQPLQFLIPQEREQFLQVIWDSFAHEAHAAYARFPFEEILVRIPPRPLFDTFHHKCAFCESPIPGEEPSGVPWSDFVPLSHFRPHSNTINFHGEHFPRHYFWLGLEWTNLHLVCRHCSQSKGSRFPIRDEARRARVPGGPDFDPARIEAELEAEGALLVDPCRDDPGEHLAFDEISGLAKPLTERGKVTLELYNLNRPQLIEARVAAVEDLMQDLKLIRLFTAVDAEELLGDKVPYAAIRRRVFELWAPSHDVDPEVPYRTEPVRGLPTRSLGVPSRGSKPRPSRKGTAAGPPRDPQPEAYALEAGEAEGDDDASRGAAAEEDDYYRQSRKIEKVVLKNFRSIEDLTLVMAPGSADRAGWTMILGENGTGKSTMLHGIALALAGESYRAQLREAHGLDASAFVRRVSEGPQPESGSVEVFLSGVPEPVRLEVRRGEPRFSGTSDPKVLLLGYGATRLLPRGRESGICGTESARVDNLFDPFVPLGDARRWLLERDPEEFEKIAAAFVRLLDLGAEVRLIQNLDEERIDVHMYDTTVPLEQLSDGYQSVVALTADIMSILRERWGSMAVAEGVVLLDELGAHLHPKWRMAIVRSLRETFPRVQFIVTTHDPLCLRGLSAGEVIVMRRDAGRRVTARTDLPPVEALRVDQLLTSEHFGLSSTLDSEVERDFDRYYELLAKDDLDADETGRLEKLKGRFASRNLLGETRRERLMLEAIDRHLAREASLDDEEREPAKNRLAKQLEETLSALEV
jgi:predicted ATPase